MEPTTAIMRGEVRRNDAAHNLQPRMALPEQPRVVQKRSITPRSHKKDIARRTLQEVAANFAINVDPDNNQLTVEQYRWISQVNTAIFAIDLINTGWNLTRVCTDLRDPANAYDLTQASINPSQAADIVCWASIYGAYFNTTTFDLLSNLEAAVYAIQVGSNFTTNTNALCNSLDLSAAPELGIDAPGIQTFVCSVNNATYSLPTSTAAQTSLSAPLITAASGTAVGTAATGGPAGPYGNATTLVGTAAASDAGNTTYPNATEISGKAPPSPTAAIYYPAWSTSTGASDQFRRY